MMKLFRWTFGLVVSAALLLSMSVMAQEPQQPAPQTEQTLVYRTIGLSAAAAFAVAVSILGAGYAVGRIGSAALGAAAEKPELLTRSILFVALAEGLAVLGFAIAMMLVQKI